MVNNLIKVYARIKKENISRRIKLENYIISRSHQNFEDLIFHHSGTDVRFSYYQFRYHKVFDQLSSQEEIFEIVAKPVVSSVIHGFNGTIFAYGQTGSGKTYSITGCPKTYENRGIIPRCIEHIFEYLNQNPEAFSIHLSYLEIYNEIGYDLLNPKQIASKLEEFPRVILLEDGKGKAHLRNLSIHAVSTEKDAMRLLFLGDTNRTIAETPMNEYSSRSHCIFTIYLTSQLNSNNKTVRSKLHVVDLAGSERIGKSTITGNTLNEAKNINLSLHYLEQVISALSSSKKHIPFRNSMLTYLLKDSLCGNSLTTMLATLAVTRKNIEETISTCRFSKRVSMITTQPIINEVESDSQQEINILQNEIYELKTKLLKYESDSNLIDYYDINQDGQKLSTLSAAKRESYKNHLEDFLSFKLNVVDLTLSEMTYCMEIMRDTCLNQPPSQDVADLRYSDIDLKALSKQKEEEMLSKKNLQQFINEMEPSDFKPIQKNIINRNVHNSIVSIGELASTNSRCSIDKQHNKIENYHEELMCTYEEAKAKSKIIEQCRQNIIILRTKMDQLRNIKIKQQIVAELYRQQDIYRKTILELRTLEKKTNHLKLGLLQAEMKRRRSSSCGHPRDDLSTLPAEHEFNWQKNTDRFIPNVPLNTPYNQLSLDLMISPIRSSDTWDSNDYTNKFLDDYNRPEKENEHTETMLTIHHKDESVSPEYPIMTSARTPSFLELIVQNSTLTKHELGPPPLEKQKPLDTNWYSEYLENNDTSVCKTSKCCDIRRKENKPLKENLINTAECLNPIQEDVKNQRSHRNILRGKPKRVTSEPKRKMMPEGFPEDSEVLGDSQKSDNEQYLTGFATNNKDSSNSRNGKNMILYEETDSSEFKEFIKSVPLTGDTEVDEEILRFYRKKFKN